MSHLKQRLQQSQPLLAPGVYDALSAALAEQAGFEALYLSGASIAYTALGRSDVGLTTFTEVSDDFIFFINKIIKKFILFMFFLELMLIDNIIVFFH